MSYYLQLEIVCETVDSTTHNSEYSLGQALTAIYAELASWDQFALSHKHTVDSEDFRVNRLLAM